MIPQTALTTAFLRAESSTFFPMYYTARKYRLFVSVSLNQIIGETIHNYYETSVQY